MSAVLDDLKQCENDGFYEDTDYEDKYIADDIDYIAADDLPQKNRRKRKKQSVLADSDTDAEETSP